jgi:hypothetical protein
MKSGRLKLTDKARDCPEARVPKRPRVARLVAAAAKPPVTSVETKANDQENWVFFFPPRPVESNSKLQIDLILASLAIWL